MRPDFIPVGAVVNAHGIRGEVKVNPAGFDPEFIASFKTLYIGGQPVKVISARVHKSTVLLALPGVATMDDALALKRQNGLHPPHRRQAAQGPVLRCRAGGLYRSGRCHRRRTGQAGQGAPLSRPQGLPGPWRCPRVPDPRRAGGLYRFRGPRCRDHSRTHDERTGHR